MKTVFLKNFSSAMEASLAQNMLKEHGIGAILQTRGVSAYTGGADLGADVMVAEKDFEKAKGILTE